MADVSKVEYGGRTLVDLTSDTVTPETLAKGVKAHDASGKLIVGTMSLIESANSIDECTDVNKLYVLPDGFIYVYMLTEAEAETAYTNLLPLATDTDRKTIYGGDYNGDGVNDGYIKGKRLSSSGSTADLSNACASGFIPASPGDVLRIKGITPIQGTAAQYLITYNSSNTKVAYQQMLDKDDNSDWGATGAKAWWSYEDGVIGITLDSNFGTGFDAVRFSCGTIAADAIVTVNEEIKEGGGATVPKFEWVNTGRTLD